MNWVINPIVQYALTSAALIVVLYLFYLMKCENTLMRKRLEEQQARTAATLESFRLSLGGLNSALSDWEAKVPVSTAQFEVAPTRSINVNKRGQALRMLRRGDAPEQIAASLQLSRNEIDLLLKVHQTTAAPI